MKIAPHALNQMGFSDITILNVAIWQATGLVTFNGPALVTDFAEYPWMVERQQFEIIDAAVA